MDQKWLKIINLLLVPVIVIILVLFWIFVPREQFMWAVIFIVPSLLLVWLINFSKVILNIS
jgi:hypothetical protein